MEIRSNVRKQPGRFAGGRSTTPDDTQKLQADESSVEVDDGLLVARLKRRDPAAMEELVRVHGGKLYGVAWRFMRNEHDAEAVMQNALVALESPL